MLRELERSFAAALRQPDLVVLVALQIELGDRLTQGLFPAQHLDRSGVELSQPLLFALTPSSSSRVGCPRQTLLVSVELGQEGLDRPPAPRKREVPSPFRL